MTPVRLCDGGYYHIPEVKPIFVQKPHELDEFNPAPKEQIIPRGTIHGVIERKNAGIAQLVEHQFCKLHVPSSTLGASNSKYNLLSYKSQRM